MTDVSTTCAEAIFRVKPLTSITNNSPSQDSNNPDDLFQSRYVTPGFKSFSYLRNVSRGNAFQSLAAQKEKA